jgi:phospholipid/cholesterol/gamma-HCH transport system substrate-binding protein
MKSFSERNPVIIGAVCVALTVAVVIGALQYKALPFFTAARTYSAHFTQASGLPVGAAVQVAGFEVGEVKSVELDGPQVLITFTVSKDIRLGDRTEAAVKTKSLLGAKILEVDPRGDGTLSGPIPTERTTPAYQLPDALGDLSATISGLDTDKVNESLATLAQTFQDTPPDLKVAVAGVARFAQTLNDRDQQLRGLLANANKVTGVLAERADKVVSLIADTNALLIALQHRSAELDQLGANISALAKQIGGLIAENRAQLRPMLDKLNGVLTIVDNHKADLEKTLKLLNAYALSLGEAVSSGPFFKAYLANLLPGQFIQPFIDAAFSDLGLDPNVLLPSQRTDPQLGQPATPALPVPYPRTGQGGEPNLTLPDAITGKPSDQPCGLPGVPLPGPGCYPYREPLPAPPPGGPPPGPPAAQPSTSPAPPAPTAVDDPLPQNATPTGPAPGTQQTGGR